MEQMKKVALGYFTSRGFDTKSVLMSILAVELNDCLMTDRRKSSTRTVKDAQLDVKEAQLDDTFGIVDFLDVKCKMNTVFAVVNQDRVPGYSPENLNMTGIADK